MASALDRVEIAGLLNATPYADVAVLTKTGPHVTPAAFAAADGRLWVVSSHRTVRVGAVRRTGQASALVRRGDRAVVVTGNARVLSLWRRSEACSLLVGGVTAACAAVLYTLRNAPTVLAGFAADLVTGAGDPTVYDRVLVSIDADRGMLLHGLNVVDTWGRWQHDAFLRASRGPGHAPAGTDLPELLAGVPPEAAAVLDRTDAATTLGWSTPQGAIALPALGIPDNDGHIQVATAALDVAGVEGAAPACVTVHLSPGARPSTFRGAVLRGRGRVLRRGLQRSSVAVQADRISWWSGFAAGTSRASVSKG